MDSSTPTLGGGTILCILTLTLHMACGFSVSLLGWRNSELIPLILWFFDYECRGAAILLIFFEKKLDGMG